MNKPLRCYWWFTPTYIVMFQTQEMKKICHLCHILNIWLVAQRYPVTGTSKMTKWGVWALVQKRCIFSWAKNEEKLEDSRTQRVQGNDNKNRLNILPTALRPRSRAALNCRVGCTLHKDTVQVQSGNSPPLCKLGNGRSRTVPAPEGVPFSNWSTQSGYFIFFFFFRIGGSPSRSIFLNKKIPHIYADSIPSPVRLDVSRSKMEN